MDDNSSTAVPTKIRVGESYVMAQASIAQLRAWRLVIGSVAAMLHDDGKNATAGVLGKVLKEMDEIMEGG
jgi:hypothetical protein